MENKINKDDIEFIEINFLNKSKLSTEKIGYDIKGEISLDLLRYIVISEEPLIKTVPMIYNSVKKNQTRASYVILNGQMMPVYHIIWGRIIAEFYYFYHDEDPARLKKTVELLLEYQVNPFFNRATRDVLNLIDAYYRALPDWEESTKEPSTSSEDPATEKLRTQITQLQQQLEIKEARIKELEALLEHPHLSFIETERKSPQDIQWAYQDIGDGVKKPATMAACLRDLQIKEMLKGQTQYGDLENIKAIFEELKEKYAVKWTYAALCRAINREKNKRKRY